MTRLEEARLAAGDKDLEAAFDNLDAPRPTGRLCLCCHKPIPDASRVDRVYCDAHCRKRYVHHTNRGQTPPKIPRPYNASPFKAPEAGQAA